MGILSKLFRKSTVIPDAKLKQDNEEALEYFKSQRKIPPKRLTIYVLLLILIIFFLFPFLRALNPKQRLIDARNTQRRQDLDKIISAIGFYQVNTGAVPAGITEHLQMLGTAKNSCNILCGTEKIFFESCLDLSLILKNQLSIIPTDPAGGSQSKTWYAVQRQGGSIRAVACGSEEWIDIVVVK